MVPGAFPAIGHLFAMGETPYLKLMEWEKEHESVFTIRLGPQT